MKAKTCYANEFALAHKRPTPCGLNIRECHGDVRVFVIPASAMDEVIELAAREMFIASERRGNLPAHEWPKLDECVRDSYRVMARAAYKAGGFVK